MFSWKYQDMIQLACGMHAGTAFKICLKMVMWTIELQQNIAHAQEQVDTIST